MSIKDVKIGANGDGKDWDLHSHQVESIRSDNKAAAEVQRAQDMQQTAKSQVTKNVQSNNQLAAPLATHKPEPTTTTQTPQSSGASDASRGQEAAKEAARPTQGAQQQVTSYAASTAPSASNILRQLESKQAPKNVDVRADVRPDAGVKTATAGAVAGTAKPDGAQVQQFRPGQPVPAKTNASPTDNLRRIANNIAQNEHAQATTEQPAQETQVAGQAAAAAGNVKTNITTADRKKFSEKSDKTKEKEETRTGTSTAHTQAAKANKNLGSLETGVGPDAGGSEAQEFGQIAEVSADHKPSLSEEASSLAIYSVDALDAQGEVAAAYLHQATVLKTEVIKSLGARLNAIASENHALDLAMQPLRERAGELKTSDFLNGVYGSGIQG